MECNAVAKRIWIWCKNRDIWLTDAHIPGKLNTETDSLSRKCNDRTERMLNPDVFQRLSDILFRPGIDLFASRLNCQTKPLLSWSPDPHELAVDAFMVNWGKWLIYARPPFSLLQKVMMKWRRDEAEGMLILPFWPTAVWYPQMLRMLVHEPVLLPKGRRTLRLAHSQVTHPLHKTLQLLACSLSGKPSRSKVFRERLEVLWASWGESTRKQSSVPRIWRNGRRSVLDGIVIPFQHL